MFTKEEISARWAAHLDKQMIEVPGTAKPGFTPVYRNAAFPMDPPDDRPYNLFKKRVAENPDAKCLGHRPWDEKKNDLADYFEWRTYAQTDAEVTALGSAISWFQEQGWLKPRENDKNISEPGISGFTVAYWLSLIHI